MASARKTVQKLDETLCLALNAYDVIKLVEDDRKRTLKLIDDRIQTMRRGYAKCAPAMKAEGDVRIEALQNLMDVLKEAWS